MSSAPAPPVPPTEPNKGPGPQQSNPTTEQSSEQPSELTESQYVANLVTLERMQDLLDNLRYTVPNLTRLLAQPPSTPEALFNEFMKKTMGPSKQLVALKKVFEEKEVKDMLERSRVSFGKKVVLKDGVEKYFKEVDMYGWVEKAQAETKGVKRKRDGGEEGVESKVLEDEELESKLVAYKAKHNDITVAEWDKELQIIRVAVQCPAAILRFTITRRIITEHDTKQASYDIKGPKANAGSRLLFAEIDRCLESSPHSNDLDYILEMLAAYKDFREAKCDKCKMQLNSFAIDAAARRLKAVKNAEDVEDDHWVALHGTCLPR